MLVLTNVSANTATAIFKVSYVVRQSLETMVLIGGAEQQAAIH
jgi:hypothetical protein